MRRSFLIPAVLALTALVTACATSFSPELIRNEIVRQTGSDPPSVFELNLGRVTMAIVR